MLLAPARALSRIAPLLAASLAVVGVVGCSDPAVEPEGQEPDAVVDGGAEPEQVFRSEDIAGEPDDPDAGCAEDADCGGLEPVEPCREARCIEGKCVAAPRVEQAACDDGDACTEGTLCLGGECGGGHGASCKDGNPCTLDTCDPLTGCAFAPVEAGTSCTDDDPCTTADACHEGQCQGIVDEACTCETREDCAPHEDGNLCNGTLACVGGVCALDVASKVTCPKAGTCRVAACSPSTGSCAELLAPNGTDCDDGNACSADDSCHDGACSGTAGACECADDEDCAAWLSPGYDLCLGPLICAEGFCAPDPDGGVVCGSAGPGPCLASVCNGATGLCGIVATSDGTPCTGEDPCTQGLCAGGSCSEPSAGCDDGDGCTEDLCLEGFGCEHIEVAEGTCEDGDPCTTGDGCIDGTCTPGDPTVCDDFNACTTDMCVPATGGCTAVALEEGTVCHASDPCAGAGQCSEGQCIDLAPLVCPAPAGPCLVVACAPGVGCVEQEVAEGASCDDGNPCTQEGSCLEGVCEALPTPCKDGNPCTADACDPAAGGCVFDAIVDGTPCTPDAPCFAAGQCQGGACMPTEAVDCAATECAALGCDPQTGACVVEAFLAEGEACGGGQPCVDPGTCTAGACEGGGPLDCDDADACTIDACEPEQDDCVHQPLTCEQPFGDGCTEAICDPTSGCKVKESAECVFEEVLYSTAFPCGEEGWALLSTGEGPELEVVFPSLAPPWDPNCALVLDAAMPAADEAWTSAALGPLIALGVQGEGTVQVAITFAQWLPQPSAAIVPSATLVNLQGEAVDVLLSDEVIASPPAWQGWAKRRVVLKVSLSEDVERRVRLVFKGAALEAGPVGAIDKLVVSSLP